MAGQQGSESSIINSSFIGRTIWLTLFWLFIQLLMILVLIPSEWLLKVIDYEDQMLYEQLGTETASYVESKGYAWYDQIFVQTGINDHVASFFYMTDEERARSTGLQDLGQKTWFPWIEGRGEALTFLLVQMFERLSHIWLWVPYSLIIAIPAIWDGYMIWKIKQSSFDYTSPFWHKFAVNLGTAITMGMTIGLFFPAPVPPFILPLMIVFVLPVLLIAMISNMPKRM